MKSVKKRGSRRGLGWACVAAIAVAACSAANDDGEDSASALANGEGAARQAELDAYLARNRAALEGFKSTPIGFNGVPYVLLRVLMHMYPDVWGPEGSDLLGFAPHPDDYGPDGKLKAAKDRKYLLPYGFAVGTEKESEGEKDVPVLATIANKLKSEGLGEFGALHAAVKDSLDRGTEKVFFSCGGCHTGRVVVDGKVKHLYGAPNTEVDAQPYTKLIMDTVYKHLLANPEEKDITKLKPNTAEVLKVLAVLSEKGIAEGLPGRGWFYADGDKTRAAKQVARVLASFKQVITNLIITAVGGHLIYDVIPAISGSYAVPGAPPIFNAKPGQMDAFGPASGITYLHLATNPKFLSDPNVFPDDHLYFAGLDKALPRAEREKLAIARLLATAKDWLPKMPAAVDIKSIFQAGDRFHAGWDGNQGQKARVVASGMSAVGVPDEVNLPVHELMNDFIAGLPAPPYPFRVDADLAKRGKPIYENRCASCHSPNNTTIYSYAQLGGIDPNRGELVLDPINRMGHVALMRQTCKGNDWCTPAGDRVTVDEEYLRAARAKDRRGYKADTLAGIWSQAPYLHNGAVPTLWHLLHPDQRPRTFVRGNINYDQVKVGFVWDQRPAAKSYDNVHTATYDTSLAGQSSKGHTHGAELGEDAKTALLEYLKTL